MQDFHPDCTINLFVHSATRGERVYWSCSLVTRKSVRLVTAEKIVGVHSRDLAVWKALEFGLLQAHRLKQEKIAVACGFLAEKDLLETRKLRDPELQLIKANCEKLYQEFRLKRFQAIAESEKKFLQQQLEENLYRGKKKKND